MSDTRTMKVRKHQLVLLFSKKNGHVL